MVYWHYFRGLCPRTPGVYRFCFRKATKKATLCAAFLNLMQCSGRSPALPYPLQKESVLIIAIAGRISTSATRTKKDTRIVAKITRLELAILFRLWVAKLNRLWVVEIGRP